jgi:hypothetical protein
MMRILRITGLLLCASIVAGCEDPASRILFEGQTFRAKASKVEKQRDVFEVSVRGVSKSPAGARQAAYHEGVSYCLAAFGSSEIAWVQDPLNTEVPLNVENDTIRFQGRCPQVIPA